jgi:hypothetical protein
MATQNCHYESPLLFTIFGRLFSMRRRRVRRAAIGDRARCLGWVVLAVRAGDHAVGIRERSQVRFDEASTTGRRGASWPVLGAFPRAGTPPPPEENVPNEPNFSADVCMAQIKDIIDVPTEAGGFSGLDKLSNEANRTQFCKHNSRGEVEMGRGRPRARGSIVGLLSFTLICYHFPRGLASMSGGSGGNG